MYATSFFPFSSTVTTRSPHQSASTMDSLETAPVVPLLFSASIAFRGFKKNSLSLSGALAAFLTGAILLSAELRVFGIMMLVFYFVGSWATKKGKELKEKYEDGVKEGGGQRDAFQVRALVSLTASNGILSLDRS